jgi:fumarate reductase subunit D/SAM-dependent methyltransferase
MITHPAPKRSLAPISWLLFGAGGMLAALFGPALIVLTGIMLPHGWGLPARLGDFAHVPGFARNPIGKLVVLVVLVVIALFLWHGAERLFQTLKDMRAGNVLPLRLVPWRGGGADAGDPGVAAGGRILIPANRSNVKMRGELLDISIQEAPRDGVPDYLRNVYAWAYLTPWLTRILDRQFVVQAILWGNAQRLIGDVLAAVKPGDRVFQPAAVYGNFSRQLARQVGPRGRLEVRDIAPVQVSLTRRKVADLPQVRVAWGDAAAPESSEFDTVTCFFLLHEVPDDVKIDVVSAMLDLVRPGGSAIFVDYHRPHRWHPVRPLIKLIFAWLEPFAMTMWRQEIEDLAGANARAFRWRKLTRFGGLYQIVCAQRESWPRALPLGPVKGPALEIHAVS